MKKFFIVFVAENLKKAILKSKSMKILFISRAYPPVVGGIENQNYEISRALSRIADVKVIANTDGKRLLPLFLPWALITALFYMRKYDVLLLGDGVLGIVISFVKLFYGKRKKVACIVHGLDLTFENEFYQNIWVKRFIPEADVLIAVGNQTIKEGVARGIKKEQFVFVPNGVDTKKFVPKDMPRTRLEKLIKGKLEDDTHVLFTGGRLVRRKGVAWFIENVLPTLPQNVIYVVSGAGPDFDNIKNAIEKAKMQERVILLGYISNEDRDVLLHTCDLFIQPNIPVKGDMEGFGLVVLEAGSSGIPVVASRLEGLKDAIHDGKNGFLVEHGNPTAWREKLTELLADTFDRKAFGRKAHEYIKRTFTWDVIAQRYIDVIEKTKAR